MIFPFIKVKNKDRLLIIFIGESNSGGFALNSDALATELDNNNKVFIWNNTSNNVFEKLDIGVNNLLGHSGLESYSTTRHGWELQLSNYADDNYFDGKNIYILKAGQGGSLISSWINTSNNWNIFISRLTPALLALSQYNLTIKVLVSIGINDAIAGTSPSTFKSNFKTFISRLRTQLGAQTPVFATQIMPAYSAINDMIVECDNEDSLLTAISITGCALQDANHWNYSGMKEIVDRFLENGL